MTKTNQELVSRFRKDQVFKDLVGFVMNQPEGVEEEHIDYVIEQAYILGHLHGNIEALTD